MVALQVWLLAIPVLTVVQVSADICPGGVVKCPDYMTCCPLANKKYGCCPFPTAICCPDHVHCCPHDMKCDVLHQACLKNGVPLKFWHVPIDAELITDVESAVLQEHQPQETNHIDSLKVTDDYEDSVCPDGRHCPKTFTCCKMFMGQYGCCPYKGAMCCRDGFHCCPQGSKCDAKTGGCLRTDGDWFDLVKAARLTKGALSRNTSSRQSVGATDPGGKCPDGHPCLEKFTCCQVVDHGYGCCPYKEAVCCSDLIHCCPKNTHCNATTGTCDEKLLSVPAFSLVTQKLSRKANSQRPVTVAEEQPVGLCPDHKTNCTADSTCCPKIDGSYSCCPMPLATCCADKKNCCPNGYQCGDGGYCEKNHQQPLTPHLSPTTPQQSQTPVTVVEEQRGRLCPDRKTSCSADETCCPVNGSSYGCCPMRQATCCADKQHCCPHGYRCSSGGYCEKNHHQPLTSFLPPATPQQTPVTVVEERHHGGLCPDKETNCSADATCCPENDGSYGCCPMPQATCCADNKHCCPNGYQCGSRGYCEKNHHQPLTPHLPAATPQQEATSSSPKVTFAAKEMESVVCPDGTQCPEHNTCCKVSHGTGCCPMPEATCCGDMEHCCPHGYWCADEGCERLPTTSQSLNYFLNKTVISH